MGKMRSCSVAMSNSWLVYRPGDTVSGTATLEIEGQLKVWRIRVICKGQAPTQWGKSPHEAPALMAAGVYKYNFSFKLPREGIPSSFEGSLGAIRYWITVEVDKPFPRLNDRFYAPFTVLANIDLNEAFYRRHVSASAQKPLSKALGIGHAGTLTASLSLDRSGYCPGEKICINLEATNDSTKDLGLVKASLVQNVNYKAADSTDSTVRTIRTLLGPKLGKGKRGKWTDELMSIDLVPPSSKSSTCHKIQVSYLVKMEVEVPLGQGLAIRIPITIGTVPLGMFPPSEHKPWVSGNSAQVQYAQCIAGYQANIG